MMTVHLSLDPCLPPSVGRGGTSDQGCTSSCDLSWPVRRPHHSQTLLHHTRGANHAWQEHWGKDWNFAANAPPPFYSQVSRPVWRKKCSPVCSPKQAYSLGWIQWKLTPAFVLAECISCQESKRYSGALWLHLLKHATACSGLSPFCTPSLGERANSASWGGYEHSTLQTMGLWPLLHSGWGYTSDPLRESWLLSRTDLGKAVQGQVHQIWYTKVNFVPL